MADLLQKFRLLRGLCTGESAGTGPFYVALDVTRRCNLSCLGCRFHSPESEQKIPGNDEDRDFPIEWAEQLFAEFEAMNTRKLFFVGDGEPLLHARIFDFIRLAKQHGISTTVTTNGTLIDETMARQLIDAGLDEVHVSLWAASREVYAQQYPGTNPANLMRVLNGLKILSSLKNHRSSRKPRIVLSNPINRFNYRETKEMVELAAEAGCDAIYFAPFKTNRGKLKRYGLSDEQQADLRIRLAGLRKRIRTLSLENNLDRFLARHTHDPAHHGIPCYIHWFHARIKVDGSVYSCGRSTLALGSLKQAGFRDIWNGAAYRQERRLMLSPSGIAHRNEICDCEYCSYVQDNRKIQRQFKYLKPLITLSKRIPGRGTH